MTIAELAAPGKSFLDRIPRTVFIIGIIILSSSASFGLGILQGKEMAEGSQLSITELGTTTPTFLKTPVKASAQPAAAAAAVATAPTTLPAGGEFVASKNGTKYYFPWCGTVKNIKEENKVWFATREAAQAAGYQPAANCEGL